MKKFESDGRKITLIASPTDQKIIDALKVKLGVEVTPIYRMGLRLLAEKEKIEATA